MGNGTELLMQGHERERRVASELVTFLCATALPADLSEEQVRTLASRHGGRVEKTGAPLCITFADAVRALELALLLQCTLGGRLQIAVSTLACGSALQVAEAALDAAAPGTIHISESTYQLVARALDRHARAAILTTELVGGLVTGAAITLPPGEQAPTSTFAGLGLTY